MILQEGDYENSQVFTKAFSIWKLISSDILPSTLNIVVHELVSLVIKDFAFGFLRACTCKYWFHKKIYKKNL